MDHKISFVVGEQTETMSDEMRQDETVVDESSHDDIRSRHDAQPSQSGRRDKSIRSIINRITPRKIMEPQVLQPDNPLMTRFQAALKAHLTRQSKLLDEEILELELELKEKSKIINDTVEIKELEYQAVFRQNVVLEKEREGIEKVQSEREKIETKLKTELENRKETTALLNSKVIKEEELRLEKESLSALIKQFSEWEESQNSEITISQNIAEKNKADKNAYTHQKIYQDLLLVALTSEVLKLTSKFHELEKNIKQKQSEVETTSQAVADGNADLEALERENQKLMRIWNQIILKIQHKDRMISDIKTQLMESQEQYRQLVSEVDSYKRSSAVEVKCNEALTQTLARLEGDVEMLERVHSSEEEKQRRLRENLVQVANMVELTQQDLNVILADTKEKETKYKVLQIEADKLRQLKFQLEEQILSKLHQQVILTKAEKQSVKLISDLRNAGRKLEAQLADVQNEHARIHLYIEQENKKIKELSLSLDREKLTDLAREKELNNLEAGLNRLETSMTRKQGLSDNLNIRISELIKRSQGEELSPDELEIRALEKALSEMGSNIEELHSSWMREQNSIVKLTQQHNSLQNQLNIYHKQTLVMRQKLMKIEFEIDRYRKEDKDMMRLCHSLENRLTNLNLQCSERKGYKESLDNQNLVSQNQLICDLKDAEVKALMVQEEMCYLEIEKEEFRGQIMEAQHELLAWEKKLQLATEVKTSIDKSKADGGEIAVMKSEIHRMEVRYAQLQKVQEKLAHDMEMCISRRDGIVELAQAREKRSTKRAIYTRQQFLKKLDDLQKKITQTNNELKAVEKTYNSAESRLTSLTEKKQANTNQLTELQAAVSQMQVQLNEGQLHKQKNLELLVRKQRKARQYGELKAGRYNLLFRQESALELEIQKQKSINADLVSIVESLNTDFPILDTQVTQILNTLRSPAA